MCKSEEQFLSKGQPEDDRQLEEMTEVDAYYLKDIEKHQFIFNKIKDK